jgi:hypothetical protein
VTRIHGGIIAVAIIFFLAGCNEHRDATSVWSASAVAIDGKGTEWADVSLDYYEEGEISWGIMNDADRLYLIIGSSNYASIRTLRQSGLTVWFNDTGEKKKKNFGIRLRGGTTTLTPPRMVEQSEGRPPAEVPPAPRDRYEMLLDTTMVDGKGHETPIERSAGDGPACAAGCDEAVCSYELSVPIRKSDATIAYALNVLPGKKIGIGVELSIPKKNRQQSMSDESFDRDDFGQGDRRRGGGSRGMSGGNRGMAGPGSAPNAPSKPLELEKKKIWLSVTLATKSLNQDADQK